MFSTSGGSVGSPILVPSTANGSSKALTNSGTATSEGALTLSPDGKFLAFAGYNAAPGTAGVTGTASASTSRTVGVLNVATGAIDTTTSLTDADSGNNIRGAALSGTNIYTSGAGTQGGVNLTTLGGTTSTNQSGTLLNTRVVNVFNGTVYASSASGSNIGINTISGGAATLVPGTGSSANAYGFYFSPNGSTLYVADATAGIQKYTLAGGTYSLAYAFTGATGLTGLAVTTNGLGQTVLYSTTPTNLYTTIDTGAAGTLTSIATAATNTAFRGVAFVPAATPEPSGVVGMIIGVGALGLLVARRRTARSA